MKRLLALALFALVTVTASAGVPSLDVTRRALITWEGYRDRPYKDGDGWSVGVGHSLTAHGEHGIWKRPYTAAEIERLYVKDYCVSIDTARRCVRDFDGLPQDVQLVVIGLVWTVGPTGFERFKSFRLALGMRAFNAAAHELHYTQPWASQVGARRRDAYVQTLLHHR